MRTRSIDPGRLGRSEADTGREVASGTPGKQTLTQSNPFDIVHSQAPSRQVERTVQQKLQAASGMGETETPAVAAAGVQSAGTALPHLDLIQRAFGRHDVRGVRAHSDPAAIAANQRMGSEGYATGLDVAFGTPNPTLHTVAHEAAHVVQQRAGVQLKGGIGAAGDIYEQHADRVADLVVQGRSAEQELSHAGASDGAHTAPAVQHKLKLTGTAEHQQRVLAVMNRGLFGFIAQVDATGFVTLVSNGIQGPPTAQQQAMYNYLTQIINDTNTVTVRVGAETPDAISGSYVGSVIDIADMEKMTGGSGKTDIGTLIHELVEQYYKQVHSMGYGDEGTGAHNQGILAENAVNGTTRGPQRTVSATQNADGTINAVVELPFTYPNGRVVTTTLTIVRNNVVSSVDRETTPARTPAATPKGTK